MVKIAKKEIHQIEIKKRIGEEEELFGAKINKN